MLRTRLDMWKMPSVCIIGNGTQRWSAMRSYATARWLLAAALALLLALLRAQDMQFGCILCADTYDKCELDCSWNNMDANATFIAECHADCRDTMNSCEDTEEATACYECGVACAEQYDSDMRYCLSQVERTAFSAASFELSSWDDCEVGYSATMDACMAACQS